MAPAPNRRQRTGNRRRGTKRHRSRLQRHLQLSHAQVGFMATLQHECLYRGGIALIHVLAIPPEEHQAAQPSRNIRFNSWDDHTCYIKTTFDKNKLLRIYRCFGLEDIAAQNNGYIRIPTGYLNQRGVPCVYNFHPEELFLYFMTRMKTGNDHTYTNNV
mmetsp:Transcript_29976/g.51043  ORF Transcript_29976/g.51043 Transcript_29976/m.51043 type:complete len:159 (-) Transcript_29976:35-511(-)